MKNSAPKSVKLHTPAPATLRTIRIIAQRNQFAKMIIFVKKYLAGDARGVAIGHHRRRPARPLGGVAMRSISVIVQNHHLSVALLDML